jgi:RNA polymerase sigma-70 factor (ECF subfamily)
LLTHAGKQLRERSVSAARTITLRQDNGLAIAYDAAKFISDERLVAIAKMGDGTVFEELRRRHAEEIFRVAHRIVRHREDAEDAVQESFLRAYVHLNTFDGRAKFSTWLTRIAINAALMKVRKNRLSREVRLDNTTETLDSCPEHEFRDFSPNPEEIYEKEEQEAALRDAIAQLRPSLRKVVELYQLQECSMNETAKVLGISVAAAKARLFHARTALRMNNVLLLKREAAGLVLHKRFFLRTGCAVRFASQGAERLCFSKTKSR